MAEANFENTQAKLTAVTKDFNLASFENYLSDQPERLSIVKNIADAFEVDGRPEFVDISQALRREKKLPAEYWISLADELKSRRAKPDFTIDAAFERLAKLSVGWVLAGPALETRPSVFGKLWEINEAASALKGLLKKDHSGAERWLWNLTRTNLKSVHETARSIPMGRYAIWGTFSEDPSSAEDPFAPESDSRSLPIELGLEFDWRRQTRKRYLMLAYSLPESIVARLPTIADAYASGSPNGRFRPHGRTHPTVLGDRALRSRPECIHEVVTMASLVRRPGRYPD